MLTISTELGPTTFPVLVANEGYLVIQLLEQIRRVKGLSRDEYLCCGYKKDLSGKLVELQFRKNGKEGMIVFVGEITEVP